MAEAGCAVVGGHSISDEGVKFGYAVTGVAHPDRIWRNSGAQPGDSLWFTKRIGTGIISTALKRGMAELSYVADCVDSMLTLNRQAAEALEGLCVHGCTDITGFGMLGHAREMALGSEATIEIEAHRVPLLPGALAYARAGAKPGDWRIIASSPPVMWRSAKRSRKSWKCCSTIRRRRGTAGRAARGRWKGV